MTVRGLRRSRFARPFVVVIVALLLRSTVVRANDVDSPCARTGSNADRGLHRHAPASIREPGFRRPRSVRIADGSHARSEQRRSKTPARARCRTAISFTSLSRRRRIISALAAGPSAVRSCHALMVPAPACGSPVHGPSGGDDLLNQLIPNGSPSHGTMGYPDMNGWPAFDVLTAQQAYWEWLTRAHQHGLKMIVMLAVNNSVLCQLAVHRAWDGCGDDGGGQPADPGRQRSRGLHRCACRRAGTGLLPDRLQLGGRALCDPGRQDRRRARHRSGHRMGLRAGPPSCDDPLSRLASRTTTTPGFAWSIPCT